MNFLLNIIFHFSIFSLLAYKFYTLTRSYMIPYLHQEINQEKKDQFELLEKGRFLISTHHRLEKQIYTQKRTFALLEKKVQAWHQSTENKIKKIEEKSRCIAEKIQQKRISQKQNVQLLNTIKLGLTPAIKEAQQKLSTLYKEEAGSTILKQVINQLVFQNDRKIENI